MIVTLAPYLSTVRTTRAAVIPYILGADGMHFLLGIDQKSKDVTDIGGGVKQHEFALKGANRELCEETNGVFDNYLSDQLRIYKSVALYDKDTNLSSVFVSVSTEMYDKIIPEFNRRKESLRKKAHREMDRLIWVTTNEFTDLVSGKTKGMWRRIRLFYSKAVDYKLIKLLEDMY